MSIRNLGPAMEAGQVIKQGKDWPDKFTGIKIIKEIEFDKHLDKVYSLEYSLDGELLAAGHGNGGIRLYNSRTGELHSELRKSRHGGLPVMSLKFNPRNPKMLLAGTSDGKLLAFDIESNTETEVATEKGNEINCIDFCRDGFQFCTAGKDLRVRLYQTSTMKWKKTFEGYSNKSSTTSQQPSQKIFALKFSPENDDIFVTGGWDNSLKIWNCENNDGVRRTIPGPHLCGDSLDWREYDLLTGSWTAQNCLQIWDYTSGELKKNIPFPTGPGLKGAYLYCARFCDNDIVLAGGSGTNSLQAINTETNEVIGEIQMQRPVQAIATTHGGRMFAAGGDENSLYIASLV